MLQSLLKSQLHCPHSGVDHSDQALFVVLCREAVLNVLAKPCDHGVSRREEKVKAIACGWAGRLLLPQTSHCSDLPKQRHVVSSVRSAPPAGWRSLLSCLYN